VTRSPSRPAELSPAMAILAIPSHMSPTPRLWQLQELRVSCLVCLEAEVLVPLAERHNPDLVLVHRRFATGLRSLVGQVRARSPAPILLIAKGSPVGIDSPDEVGRTRGNAVDGARPVDVVGPSDVIGADGVLFEDRPLAPRVAGLVPALLDRPASGLIEAMRWGPLLLDGRSRRAFWEEREIRLTTHQFRAMSLLCQARGGMVSIEALSARLYGDRVGADRKRVVAHIRRVRRLIEVDPARPLFLLTVRGEGFRLADPVGSAARVGWLPRTLGEPAPDRSTLGTDVHHGASDVRTDPGQLSWPSPPQLPTIAQTRRAGPRAGSAVGRPGSTAYGWRLRLERIARTVPVAYPIRSPLPVAARSPQLGGWRIHLDPATGQVHVTRPDGSPYEIGPSHPWTTPTIRADDFPDAA
jgi:DNA-binding winged helix-turn-helix (wHTH) protein